MRDDLARAERAGYAVGVDLPGDDDTPATIYVRTPRGPHGGLTRTEPDRLAAEEWRADLERRVEAEELADTARTSASARARLDDLLREEVARLSARFPDAELDVHDGNAWLAGRRWHSIDGLEAALLMRERADAAEAEYRASLDETADRFGFRVRLTYYDGLRRDNLHAPWREQVVDVLAPAAHPAVPDFGSVMIVDREVVIDTATRKDLAARWGVAPPETLDERIERRDALATVQREHEERAARLSDPAREAADAARR